MDPVTKFANLVILLVIAILVTVGLVWLIFGTEQWRVGPDLLEVHKECLGRKWGPRFTQAELLIRCEWRSRGRSRQRVCLLIARNWGKEYILSESSASGSVQLQALGSYLSAQTGWPLQLPLEWPPAPLLWGLF